MTQLTTRVRQEIEGLVEYSEEGEPCSTAPNGEAYLVFETGAMETELKACSQLLRAVGNYLTVNGGNKIYWRTYPQVSEAGVAETERAEWTAYCRLLACHSRPATDWTAAILELRP